MTMEQRSDEMTVTNARIEAATTAVRDEYGSLLCAFNKMGRRVCRAESDDQSCKCQDIARAALAATDTKWRVPDGGTLIQRILRVIDHSSRNSSQELAEDIAQGIVDLITPHAAADAVCKVDRETWERCAQAALSACFGPPSSWGAEYPQCRYNKPLRYSVHEASMHDNGVHDAFAAIRALSTSTDDVAGERRFEFDRYRNNTLLAEGVCVHAKTLEEALAKAASLYRGIHSCRNDRYVLRTTIPLSGDGT